LFVIPQLLFQAVHLHQQQIQAEIVFITQIMSDFNDHLDDDIVEHLLNHHTELHLQTDVIEEVLPLGAIIELCEQNKLK